MKKKETESPDSSQPVSVAPVAMPPSTAQEKMSDTDRMQLELAKSKLETAKTQAETAHLAYRYTILQLYVKYGLNVATDSITEAGEIHRGGAVPAK